MNMREVKPAYVPGDRCRIRGWDDMAKEFQVKSYPGAFNACFINTPGFVFTSGMRRLCGMEFTVSHVTPEPISWDCRIMTYHSVEGVECSISPATLYITADMLEPIDGSDAEFSAPEIEWR